jgi:pyruvate dehydrogenase (quinone)
LLKDIAGAYVVQASSPAQVRHLVDRAVRIALAQWTVTAIVLPNDLQDEAYADPPRAHGTLRSGVGYAAPKIVPRMLISILPPRFSIPVRRLRCSSARARSAQRMR